MDHLHYCPYCCGSHWRVVVLLPHTRTWLSNTREYHFRLLLVGGERTPESLIKIIIYTYIFIELSLAFPLPPSAAPSCILPGGDPIASRLRYFISLLLLPVVVEVVEHQIQVLIYVFSQVVLSLLIRIHRYSDIILLVTYAECARMRVTRLVYRSGLWEVRRAHRLMNPFLPGGHE